LFRCGKLLTLVNFSRFYVGSQLSITSERTTLDQQSAMNGFLRDIERRALRMAQMSTGNRDDALEIVQDTMMGLVRRYSDRPSGEWRPLFYSILRSRINDFHRRRVVRARVMAVMPWSPSEDADDMPDPLDSATAGERENPVKEIEQDAATDAMIAAIQRLPTRQQQAFMLRAWEGMSVEETANAMGCSQGSVKTHYSRALKNLQQQLEDVRPS
jgi:RNA polymerase sigma-70 factor (ECF subfamily)